MLMRHNEIRAALSFFLSSWYKARQAGTSIESKSVLLDFVKFRSLDSVTGAIKTSHPQIIPPKGPVSRGGGQRH